MLSPRPRQRMIPGKHSHEALLEQCPHLDARARVAVAHERKIERAVEQRRNLHGRRQFPQTEFHLWILTAIALDRIGQRRKHHRSRESDRKRPLLPATEAADLREIVLDLFDRAARALGEQLPGKRQPDAACRAIE